MGILLGFEIGTGSRVEVPSEGHFAVFGQTQLSGKTTAIEGLVYRSSFKAVAFITKRGEGSFLTARIIPPFFSEPTNDPEQPLWRWVKSILEASQRRRLQFEESFIIRACEHPRHAETLDQVWKNIKDLLAGEKAPTSRLRKRIGAETKWLRRPATGMPQSMYTSLDAYFGIVMPQLARLPYTKQLKLDPGLSVMDLRDYSIEMQALVIRAVMEHVYKHERNVRVIVPEAWQFVPEHRNTPVKMASEILIRMGAADKNFLWLDSQDMAAVDKTMLRACSVVCCGVQRELNEIDRTIDSLFHGEITPRHIGSLKIGEFYVCIPGGEVKKVYVQPAWMDSELHAQAIARGEESINSARPMEKAFEKERETEDDVMWKQKYDALKDEYGQLEAAHQILTAAHDALAARVSKMQLALIANGADPAKVLTSADEKPAVSREAAAATKANPEARSNPDSEFKPAAASSGNGHVDIDALYLAIKERAAKDPGILELLATRPELHVKITRQKIEADGSTLRGGLAALISERFFESPQNANRAFIELKRRGRTVSIPNVYRELDKLAELGFVTKEANGYQAVAGMKVHIEEA